MSEELEEPLPTTSFDVINSRFLDAVTDDMYLEFTKEETDEMLDDLIVDAITWFEYPKGKNLDDYNLEKRCFNCKLDNMEINIIVKYMVSGWVSRQLAVIDLIKQKYTGSDFKLTSQASHIKQLLNTKQEYEREGKHLQRMYSRRKKDENGIYVSDFGRIMEVNK